MKKKNIGSSFDSWLREEGLYEEVTATAIKRVRAAVKEGIGDIERGHYTTLRSRAEIEDFMRQLREEASAGRNG
jgi:predicted transcriptional regulator